MSGADRDALVVIRQHRYELSLGGQAICACGWPESRRGIETTLQEAHEVHLADYLVVWLPPTEPTAEGKPVQGCMACATYRAEGRACPTHRAVEPTAEPQAMTLSHDRLVLQRKDEGTDLPVVLVRCPHMIGLCFEGEEYLSLLPCPCNDPSVVIAELVPRDEPTAEHAGDTDGSLARALLTIAEVESCVAKIERYLETNGRHLDLNARVPMERQTEAMREALNKWKAER